MVSRIYPIHTLESGALSVQVIKHGSGFQLQEHAHAWSCFQVVLRGRFRDYGTGGPDAFRPWPLIYRPAGVHH